MFTWDTHYLDRHDKITAPLPYTPLGTLLNFKPEDKIGARPELALQNIGIGIGITFEMSKIRGSSYSCLRTDCLDGQ